MTEPQGPHGGPIDQAALVVAGLAATITLIQAEGPWEPLSIPLGITILLAVLAFYEPPSAPARDLRTLARRGVFASVGGLAICILLGWVLQKTVISWIYQGSCSPGPRVPYCLAGKTTDSFIVFWPLAAIVLWVIDHKVLTPRAIRSGGATSRPAPPSAEKESPA